jgi:hypothetical protein
MVPLGDRVKKNTLLGVISDPFGEKEIEIMASFGGIVIGKAELPLVNEGDAIYHIARFEDVKDAEAKVDEFREKHFPDPNSMPDADSPIT